MLILHSLKSSRTIKTIKRPDRLSWRWIVNDGILAAETIDIQYVDCSLWPQNAEEKCNRSRKRGQSPKTFCPFLSFFYRLKGTDMYTWIRDRVAPVECGFSMQRRHRSQGVLRPRWHGWRARSEYSTSTRNAIVIKLVEFRVLTCLLYM